MAFKKKVELANILKSTFIENTFAKKNRSF